LINVKLFAFVVRVNGHETAPNTAARLTFLLVSTLLRWDVYDQRL